MKKILILVEGQTEETFIKRVLAPHLLPLDTAIVPTIIVTKRVKNGPDFKGGVPPYPKVRRDILRLLGDTSAVMVTTMIDYYGLPESFPGKGAVQGASCYDRVDYLEKALSDDIDTPRFCPYYSLHEFEALLFASPKDIAQAFPGTSQEPALTGIRQQFASPEEIDDGTETAPSKRLKKIFPGYGKLSHGTVISNRIGLEAIRQQCAHFNSWLARLEVVANERL